jgi:hypothetical protein
MSQTFAQVVEHVKHLSLAEKQELQELLRKYLIEERRLEILDNGEAVRRHAFAQIADRRSYRFRCRGDGVAVLSGRT